MAGHGSQHTLEFGGSRVGSEFDGSLQFRLVDRIPWISVSHEFTEQTARQVRYALVGTVGPERPFYHRYLFVVLDVRMISAWHPGAAEFVNALRDRMQRLGGELIVVTTDQVPIANTVPIRDTPEDAIAHAKHLRAEKRSRLLQG